MIDPIVSLIGQPLRNRRFACGRHLHLTRRASVGVGLLLSCDAALMNSLAKKFWKIRRRSEGFIDELHLSNDDV